MAEGLLLDVLSGWSIDMGKVIAVLFFMTVAVTMVLQFVWHSNKIQKINVAKACCWALISGMIASMFLTVIILLF